MLQLTMCTTLTTILITQSIIFQLSRIHSLSNGPIVLLNFIIGIHFIVGTAPNALVGVHDNGESRAAAHRQQRRRLRGAGEWRRGAYELRGEGAAVAVQWLDTTYAAISHHVT